MKNIKNIIQNYMNNKISLKTFEDEIIELDDNISSLEDDILSQILEDIAYTYTGEANTETKELNLISETELKKKLNKYLDKLSLA